MRTVRDVGEFGLIERIVARARRAGVPAGPWRLGPGDDAAVARLPRRADLVVSVDAAIEGVHFRWATDRPGAVGARALAAALSDLAAMGASPVGGLLALELPARLPLARLDRVVDGLVRGAVRWEVPLAGGNVSRGRHTALHLTVLGTAPPGRMLRRDAARPGDGLFVTGRLGAAALARARAQAGGPPVAHVPTPRLLAGRRLAAMAGAGACIDVSDGLLADLAHLLRASGVGAELWTRALPRMPARTRPGTRPALDPLAAALGGGEDYELLFTARGAGAQAGRLTRRLGVRVTQIGQIVAEPAVRLDAPVPRRVLRHAGWRHF